MRPSYDTDTLILVKKTDPSQIQVGDVISFYSADPALDGAVNTHRVIAIEEDGTEWKYTTQGDANNIPDQYGTDSEALIGKVVASSLALGKLARLVANPLVFIPVILIPLAVILISNLVRTIRLAGKIAKDEEEAAVREAIREIQSVTSLPLQIDTVDETAMEAAMRIYNGKPMVNSVNGKQEIMDQVFPLIKKIRRCGSWSDNR